MPHIKDTYAELGDVLDMRPTARGEYERSMARKGRILDIGGRNAQSASAHRLRNMGATDVVATDVVDDYKPDLVDDITASQIGPASFDGVYCDAILEHVKDYWSAIENIMWILKPDGEAFFYVPFCFEFHDLMDYHRFTITELARMMKPFSESKVFLAGPGGGYGYVLLDVLTYGRIRRHGKLHNRLARAINSVLAGVVRVKCKLRPNPDYTTEQAVFYFVHLRLNHGFCAWVRR